LEKNLEIIENSISSLNIILKILIKDTWINSSLFNKALEIILPLINKLVTEENKNIIIDTIN
jgi:hypothetical protein